MHIVAISGSYRAGGTTDTLVDAVVEAARAGGAEVDMLTLRDLEFGYCSNCQACWNPNAGDDVVGPCPIDDALTPWIPRVATADGLVLAAPVNLGVLTALFKKFTERCAAACVHKPLPRLLRKLTGLDAYPVARAAKPGRKLLWITSSGAPAGVGRWVMPGVKQQFKAFAGLLPGKVVDFIWAGGAGPGKAVSEKHLARARRAGQRLARG